MSARFIKAAAPVPVSLLIGTLLWLLTSPSVSAQYSRTIHDGYTPTGVEQGSPAGAYLLNGFETVNLFNGNLSVAFPLMKIGGRGSAGYTMTLLTDMHWEIYRQYQDPVGGTVLEEAQFRAGQSWRPGYSPGFLLGRSAAASPVTGFSCTTQYWNQYLTRLSFIAPDGSEILLYDKKYNGAPYDKEWCSTGNTTRNRGKVFVSADGESMTFISDTDILDDLGANLSSEFYPSGHLLMKDGTRYRIDQGRVSWIRDRNGNKVSLTYQQNGQGIWRVSSITDSLNRVINIAYATTSTGYDEITFKGYNQNQRSLKIWYSPMQNILRPDATIKTAAQLFPEIYGNWNLWPGNWNHNPTLVSKIEMPDQRAYQFFYNSYGETARIILPTGGGFDYDYAPAVWNSYTGTYLNVFDLQVYRRVSKRSTFNVLNATTDPVNPPAGTREKVESHVIEANGYPTIIRVEGKTSGNTLLTQSRHHFYGSPLESAGCSPIAYSWWPSGKEFKTEVFNVSNGTAGSVLRKTEPTWFPAVTTSSPPGCITAPAPHPRISETVSTLGDSNQVSKQTFSYDQYNNQTDVYEYDYGTGAAGGLLRRNHTDYLTSGYDTISGGINNPDPNTTIHLRSLPTQTQVFDAGGVLRAQAAFEYDNYTLTDSTAPLTARGSISGHDSATYSTSYLTRGNVTRTTSYLINSSGTVTGSISGYPQYDIAGNVVKTIDGRGNAVTVDYSDRFGSPDGEARNNAGATELAGLYTFAFPTKVTNALGHEAYTQFDYHLGKPVDTEDPNNIKSSLYYNDALDRPTQGRDHVTSSTTYYRQTTISYDDVNKVITTSTDKDTVNDNVLTGKAYYDGLGRAWRKASYEGNTGSGNTWSIVETQFDALGRAYRACNPFRASTPNAALPGSPEWTTTTFDALSRATMVTTPDTAFVETRYFGNVVTVIDQAKKVRRSVTDALGRLTRVDEPSRSFTAQELTQNPLNPDLLLGISASPVQPTYYGYDVLGNLLTVNQGGQTRTFNYDSLSRLTSATNPESGAMSYAYDNNGNLSTKTDARNLMTTYTYDALNRTTKIEYSSGPNGSGTIELYYDLATNGKGRFHYSVSYNPRQAGTAMPYYHADVIGDYDVLGRPISKWQGFAGFNAQGGHTTWYQYNLSRTYNLAGGVISETYPSGRTVNYSYDAAGQLSSFTGKLGGLANGTNDVSYASGMKYNPRGQMIRETFGTNALLYHRMYYNRRGQMFDTRIGTDSNAAYDVENPAAWRWANGTWNRGALRLYYSSTNNDYDDYTASGPALVNNNGNVWRSEHFVPNAADAGNNITSWVLGSDAYDYDELNRVTAVTETAYGGTGQGFTQKFLYDRWGNRTIDVTNTTDAASITRDTFAVNTTNNRLTQKNGVTLTYDAVGNQTYDATGNRYYDAENKIGKAVQGSVTSYYYYDGAGRRGRRVIGGAETWQVYGFEGQMVAEYNISGTYNGNNPPAAGSPAKEYGYRGGQMLVVFDSSETGDNQLKWLVMDQLGSTRMLVNRSGALNGIKRRDYLPFGEEVSATLGHRAASGAGYPASNNLKQKFTGYERDDETGLDYAQARYCSSVQGRFTSADPLLTSASIEHPQSWNRYAYVHNNPLKFTDPFGLYVWSDELGGTASDADIEAASRLPGRDGEIYRRILERRQRFQQGLEAARTASNSSALKPEAREEVQRAVNAYGSFNDGRTDNVVVGFVAQNTVSPNVAFGARDGKIHVDLNLDLENRNPVITIAHEGSHIADFQAYLAGGSDVRLFFTENRAYFVSSYVAEALGLDSYYPNQPENAQVWNRGWREQERTLMRTNGVLSYNPWSLLDQGLPISSTQRNNRY